MEKIIIRKIKEFLKYHNKSYGDYANKLGIDKQKLSNKFYKQNFTAKDLMKLCELCEGHLAFVCKDGTVMYLEKEETNNEL